VFAIGYGRENQDDTLSYGREQILNSHACARHLRPMHASFACTSPKTYKGASICQGDSGGTFLQLNEIIITKILP